MEKVLKSHPFRPLTVSFALLGLSACAIAPTPQEREAAFLALPLSHFQNNMYIKDDPLDPNITIHTRLGYRDYVFDFGAKEDQFLRALVFREDGKVALQAYVTSDTSGSWLHPVSVSFPHTLSTRRVDRLHFDVNCATYGCRHYEEMVFEFTPEELDDVIKAMDARKELVFAFRIKGQSGIDRDGRFHISELEAFREVVASYLPNGKP